MMYASPPASPRGVSALRTSTALRSVSTTGSSDSAGDVGARTGTVSRACSVNHDSNTAHLALVIVTLIGAGLHQLLQTRDEILAALAAQTLSLLRCQIHIGLPHLHLPLVVGRIDIDAEASDLIGERLWVAPQRI